MQPWPQRRTPQRPNPAITAIHTARKGPALDAIRATDVIAAVDKLLDATSHQGG